MENPVDIKSREFVFANDLLDFVMGREYGEWNSIEYMLHRSPVTPFSVEVRNAVERFLKREATYMAVSFSRDLEKGPINFENFPEVANGLRCRFNSVQGVADLLRYCTLVCHYSLSAYKQGETSVPYEATMVVHDTVRLYIEDSGISADEFWLSLRNEVSNLLLVNV